MEVEDDPMEKPHEEAGPSSAPPPNSDSDSLEDESEDDDTFLDDGGQRKKKSRRTKGLSKLNPNLKGLMGEANVRYARGDVETAKKMCFEVMRQVPDAYEPYLTLAQIFETCDITKYEGYLSIASCLYTQDSSIWCRLAELNYRNKKLKEAMSCYSKALRVDNRNIDLHKKRLELAEEMGEVRFALACKKNLASKLPKSQYQLIIDLCKEVTEHFHGEKNYLKALEVLQIPFKRVPKRVTEDLVNMMLELLLLTNRFTECLDIFIQFCNFTFEITVDSDKKIIVNSYEMPASIQIDLKVKFMVCLIRMKSSLQLISPLIDSLLIDENVETIGDLYLDVAEDLMSAELFQEALKLLIPLVKSKTYSLAAVWLKYAECLNNCNMLEQSVEAYFTVMHMAPQHVEVLYPLAKALLKLDKKSEALNVLSLDLSSNKVDVAVLIERLKLLREIEDFDEYWKCAELFLSRHCIVLRYFDEIKIIMTLQTHNEKVKKLRKMRSFRRDSTQVESNLESIREPTLEIEFQVYKDILRVALESRNYAQLQKLAFMGLTSKKFINQYYKDLVAAAFFSCMYNGDTFHGYTMIRDLVYREPENVLAWNLFNLLLQSADEVRHYRFISRFQIKFPHMECLHIIESNYWLYVGNFYLATKYYMREFRKTRSPFFAFMLGAVLLQSYSKRRNSADDKRKLAETVSYLFLYYAKNRSKDAQGEIYYNLGRMYHQLGVSYLAEFYYLKVLDLKSSGNEDMLSLTHESAYNLHLIYKNSGNFTAARNILIKFVTI